MYDLILKRGSRYVTRYKVSTDQISIGRGKENSIILLDPDISRRHCLVEFTPNGLLVRDESVNGIIVNGEKKKRATLNSGDTIAIGQWVLEVAISRDTVPNKTVISSARSTQIVKIDGEMTNTERCFLEFDLKTEDGRHSKKKVFSRYATLGSNQNADVVIEDPFVSRNHCKIINDNGRLLLIDLASTNGTYFCGVKIEKSSIPDKGEFVVGKTSVKYALKRADVDSDVDFKKRTHMGGLIGRSDKMRAIYDQIEKISLTDATVCIQGESGTGKELVAREVHNLSRRSNGSFVAINCGAMPANLIESLLFGHERGAYTGAIERTEGLFQEANGGTMFLDEIGEMPMELQTRLLRVMETRTVRRIGGKEDRSIDVRIICATNKDIKRQVKLLKFRDDLYYRIFVAPIILPPLRERREDIGILAMKFLRKVCDDNRSIKLTEGAIARLKSYDWPGNVRELKNVIERSVIYLKADVMNEEDILLEQSVGEEGPTSRIDKDTIEASLTECAGNLSMVSRRLGVSRTTIQKKIKSYGVVIKRY